MPEFGVARDVPTNLDLERCLAIASTWLEACQEQHPACTIEEAALLPSRLLDLGTGKRVDEVHLREFRNVDRDHIRYMTLSHCWGKEEFLTTTKSTLLERKTGILVSQLPKTFQDAIEITHGLGTRYLWIDSLCIIQDDISDWEFESAKMASIYSGSFRVDESNTNQFIHGKSISLHL